MWLEGKSKAPRQVLHHTIKEGKEVYVFEFLAFESVMQYWRLKKMGNNQLYEMVHVKE